MDYPSTNSLVAVSRFSVRATTGNRYRKDTNLHSSSRVFEAVKEP